METIVDQLKTVNSKSFLNEIKNPSNITILILKNFNNETNENKEINDKNILYFKKIIKPSDEEKSEHDQYLKTSLKKNFFN